MADVTQSLFVTCAHCSRGITAAQGRRRFCDNADCRRERAALRKRASRRDAPFVPITTVTFGTNDELIADVAKLYLRDDAVVADVTYSSGRFWRKTDLSRFRFVASDLIPQRVTNKVSVTACDFRALPYRDQSLDAVIFDPPYIHSPGKGMLRTRYNGLATTDMASYADIMQLYQDGMSEAARVLRDGGHLWVKCKDTLASERQRWSHITIYGLAEKLGLYARDFFLLVPPAPTSVTTGRWSRQLHARKVHSYLWIFEAGGFHRRT